MSGQHRLGRHGSIPAPLLIRAFTAAAEIRHNDDHTRVVVDLSAARADRVKTPEPQR